MAYPLDRWRTACGERRHHVENRVETVLRQRERRNHRGTETTDEDVRRAVRGAVLTHPDQDAVEQALVFADDRGVHQCARGVVEREADRDAAVAIVRETGVPR